MSRLTLRLPESLHRQLDALAKSEAVSLNQFIVFALTRQVTSAYTVQPVADETRAEQRAAFAQLLEKLGTTTDKEIKQTLAQRLRTSRERKRTYRTKSGRTPRGKNRKSASVRE